MSFILDALRKSDARRQQSGAPGLNSPEPPRPPRRRRRLLPGLAIALVLVAVSATAVYLFRPGWWSPGAGEDRQVRAPASEPASPQDAPGTGQSEQLARTGQADEAPDAGTTDDASDAAEPEQSQAQSDRSRERRRRRRVPPDEQEAVVQDEPPQRESAPVSAEEATEELERRMAEAASRRREESAQREDEREDTRQPEREASSPAGEQAPEPGGQEPEAGSEALNDEVAEYVRAWELPLSVRRSLPDLTLTIHVYSPDEAERFVLINGERHVAGDEIDGARIVDIRREGAIVDFRSHRFLLEPR